MNDFKKNINEIIKKNDGKEKEKDTILPEGIKKPDVIIAEEDETTTKKGLKLKKNREEKTHKKAMQVYIDAEKQKELDKIARKSGYSRNELINIFIDYAMDQLELEE